MKKVMAVFLALMVFTVPCVRADQEIPAKFIRGVVNIVTSPVEIPKQARAYWIKGAQKTPHIIAWITCGVVWGVVQTFKRAGHGLWDVVSSPFANPNNMTATFTPQYVFEEWPVNPKSGR